MDFLVKLLTLIALACFAGALLIKLTGVGTILPGPMPINWIKLTDTFLLFSIAISLMRMGKNKQ